MDDEKLPTDPIALQALEQRLVQQLAQVRAAQAALDDSAPRWWIQRIPHPPGRFVGYLHYGDCFMPGQPTLRRADVLIELERQDRNRQVITDCNVCRPLLPLQDVVAA
ncbi:hypothetical protein ACQEVS_10045 [Streptomyces sp. CA-181903]|uniref:hypothetical protein n=1 Tax=Streptomyces sp. CA-181903 TaxID=3240055 RepID=UPI003D90E249